MPKQIGINLGLKGASFPSTPKGNVAGSVQRAFESFSFWICCLHVPILSY